MPEYRRGEPRAIYARNDGETNALVRLVTDGRGVVEIKTDAERRAADAWHLPVTRLPKLGAKEVRDIKHKEADR